MSDDEPLTKKQRGRLKKLRKKISETKVGSETSGLTSRQDWEEWKQLSSSNDSDNGPCVRLRNVVETCEGTDHMHILGRFLSRNQVVGKKRKRNKEIPQFTIPSWATLHNPAAADRIAVIQVQLENNLECKDVSEQLQDVITGKALPTRWFQGESPKSLSNVLMYLPKNHGSSRQEEQRDKNDDQAVVSLLLKLVLTKDQQAGEGYPMAKEVANDDSKDVKANDKKTYVATTPDGDVGEPRVFGLDCEMVQTAAGSELARITLIQLEAMSEPEFSYVVVLDELVKPHLPILNYLTEYSGINRTMLENVETRLNEVQEKFLHRVHANDVLVGHSLENDLHAVGVVHDRVVDTAVLFQASNGKKYSLRHLSAVLLKKHIQHQKGGHCSQEDAAAALELAVRRAQQGDSFCIHERNANHLFGALPPIHKTVCVGPAEWLQQHVTTCSNSAHALSCSNVSDTNSKAIESYLTSTTTRKADLVWANLVVENEQHVLKLRELLSRLVTKLPSGTIVLVALQQGHNRAMASAKQRKACRDHRSTTGWSVVQEQAHQDLLEKSRYGAAFWIGTRSSTS